MSVWRLRAGGLGVFRIKVSIETVKICVFFSKQSSSMYSAISLDCVEVLIKQCALLYYLHVMRLGLLKLPTVY